MLLPHIYHSLFMLLSRIYHSLFMLLPHIYHSLFMLLPHIYHSLFMLLPSIYHSLFMLLPSIYHSLFMVQVDVVSASKNVADHFQSVAEEDLLTQSLNAIINRLGRSWFTLFCPVDFVNTFIHVLPIIVLQELKILINMYYVHSQYLKISQTFYIYYTHHFIR